MTRKQFSRYRLVHDLIVAFKRLTEDRENVVTEIEDFCKGYREGRAEVWVELLALDVEQVCGRASASTLAETMTHMKIKHGHTSKARA
jgi:hypothetical protein